jgi:hypothetical protein
MTLLAGSGLSALLIVLGLRTAAFVTGTMSVLASTAAFAKAPRWRCRSCRRSY